MENGKSVVDTRRGLWDGLCRVADREFKDHGISHSQQGNLKIVPKGPVFQPVPKLGMVLEGSFSTKITKYG